MSLQQALVRQFHRPHGPLGHVAGWIMSRRGSNLVRNRWTVDLLGLAPEHRVLEIGFGPGVALGLCAGRVPRGRVVGLEHSLTMFAQAARRNRRLIEEGRLGLVLGGPEDLPDAFFDRIFSCNVAQFWKEPGEALDTLRRKLRPGGVMATTFMPRSRGATRENSSRFADRFQKELTEHGFGVLDRRWLEEVSPPAVCLLASAG